MESSTHTLPRISAATDAGDEPGARTWWQRVPWPRPELAGLMALAAILYLWGLSQNGFANDYYSGAVRSMSTSWHDFLYGSFDSAGLMTVDKPPMALWVQALSVRVFGFHSLSILVPQALMGIASVALLYDLTRRVWGRTAGFAAGLVLALTPIVVAISRHNNPDALLVLFSVAALWFGVRAFEDGRTRWLVFSGLAVGLGFETKMAVALMVVPGIAAAWLWIAPQGRPRAFKQLLAGGGAMIASGFAWPLLVLLTPSADRPWISGTSDNSILSLIFGYNGFGRLTGQAGGPQAFGGGGPFGGSTGIFRLFNESLGGQAGWLLGAAIVGGLGAVWVTRLRRDDPRTGWIIAVGGAFATTAVAFSFAGGIFHPYYVSLLAPFAAALIGAVVGIVRAGGLPARIVGPAAIVAGAITELVVRSKYPDDLTWLPPVLLVLGGAATVALALPGAKWRSVALAVGMGALLIAPAAWSAETLGHATSGTFPAGGPEAASSMMGGPGGGGPGGGFPGAPGGAPSGGGLPGAPGGSASGGGLPGAPGGSSGPARLGAPPAGGVAVGGMPPGMPTTGSGSFGGPPSMGSAGAQMGAGGPGGASSESLNAIVRYTKAHGGGTIGVSSQSEAASSIVSSDAPIAGLGGFSGRESAVSVSWLAQAVNDGKVRWVLDDGSGAMTMGADGRAGSADAFSAAASACTKVRAGAYASGSSGSTSSSAGSSALAGGRSGASTATLYDCVGKGDAIAAS